MVFLFKGKVLNGVRCREKWDKLIQCLCYDKNLDEIKRPAIGGTPICVVHYYLWKEPKTEGSLKSHRSLPYLHSYTSAIIKLVSHIAIIIAFKPKYHCLPV